MSARKRGLGRGLDALLGAGTQPRELPEGDVSAADGDTPQQVLKDLPVDLIQRGKYQPRRDIDPESLQELADSIRAQGIMQPIVVRPVAERKYEIIAGERRWRAAQLAGLDHVPAVVRDVSDEAAIAMALIENIQREDLNPIEEAIALQRLQQEFQLTQQEVADAVGKSRMDPNIRQLQDDLSQKIGARVQIQHGAKGKGKLVLTYNSLDELDGILSHIR